MLLVDVNVLVHAYREDSPDHHSFQSWLTELVRSGTPFGVADLVLSGFLLKFEEAVRELLKKGKRISSETDPLSDPGSAKR